MSAPDPIELPGRVHVTAPMPRISVTPPSSSMHNVPIAGPPGPTGDEASHFAALSDIDVGTPAEDTPQILKLGADGIYRLNPMPVNSDWPEADALRFGDGPPTDDAPSGVWHADYSTGQLWENQ